MEEWLKSFSNENFMPHGHCYLWRPDILWTHVLSDLTIALAYFAIPTLLGVFLLKQRKIIPYPEIIVLFCAFIFLCGMTHLVTIYVTWFPAYEPQGWLKALTALVSVATAIVLIPKLPKLLALPGIHAALEVTIKALGEVKQEKAEMEAIFDVANNREARVLALKHEVNQLLQDQGLPTKYLKGEQN